MFFSFSSPGFSCPFLFYFSHYCMQGCTSLDANKEEGNWAYRHKQIQTPPNEGEFFQVHAVQGRSYEERKFIKNRDFSKQTALCSIFAVARILSSHAHQNIRIARRKGLTPCLKHALVRADIFCPRAKHCLNFILQDTRPNIRFFCSQ